MILMFIRIYIIYILREALLLKKDVPPRFQHKSSIRKSKTNLTQPNSESTRQHVGTRVQHNSLAIDIVNIDGQLLGHRYKQ